MIKLKENTSGVVEISDEVIAVIANTSALEVEGIAGTENNFANGIAEILGKKNYSKGVKIDIDKENTNIKLAMSLSVKYGYKIPDVIFKVQEKIKSSIETMTGLRVTQININVLNIFFDTENKKKNSKK